MEKIIKNAIRCNACGDEIESKHVHDFRYCSCKAVAVDGGHEYLRRLYDVKGYTDLSIMENPDGTRSILVQHSRTHGQEVSDS